MSAVRKFEEFVASGVVKRHSPNKSRAEFLFREAGRDFSFLSELREKIPVTSNNTNNFVKHCYDVLMELIRANMLLAGYSASGLGAHEAEVPYLRVFGFKEKEVEFADQLRYFRNGMLYYGIRIDKEYTEIVFDFVEKVYPRLKKEIGSE